MIYPDEFEWLKQDALVVGSAETCRIHEGWNDEKSLFNNSKKMLEKAGRTYECPLYWFNRQGFRDKPGVENIDFSQWRKSIVVIGDSFAFGQGVNWEHSFSGYLEQLTGRKVINLARGATSNLWMWGRVTSMLESVAPGAVVCFWTEFARTYVFGSREHVMPTIHEHHAMSKFMITNPLHAQHMSWMLFRSLKQQLKDVPQAHITWNAGMKDLVTLISREDVCHDQGHWGPITHATAARSVVEQLSVFL